MWGDRRWTRFSVQARQNLEVNDPACFPSFV